MAYMRLGDLLVSSGVISPEQLEDALKNQKESRQRLGDVLIQNGYITEQHLIDALQVQLGVDFIDLTAVSIPVELAKYVPRNIAKKYCVVPVKLVRDQNSLPFGICLAFFSLPVPEYNIQAALSQLHQFRASVPYLPCRDTESHRSYHMYQAAPPIPSKILPALLPSEGNNVLAGFFSFESSLSEEQP